MEQFHLEIVAGATKEDLEAALELVSKVTWCYYSSFLPREQAIIEKAVVVDGIRRKENGGRALKPFLEKALAEWND